MKNVYKFVKWDVQPVEDQKDTNHYKLLEKLNNGETLTRQEKDSLSLYEYCGCIHVGGWCFNFRPYLKTFWIKTKYDGIIETYAFDKTNVRALFKKNYMSQSQIIKIVEVN